MLKALFNNSRQQFYVVSGRGSVGEYIIVTDLLPLLSEPKTGVPYKRVKEENRFNNTLKEVSPAVSSFDMSPLVAQNHSKVFCGTVVVHFWREYDNGS